MSTNDDDPSSSSSSPSSTQTEQGTSSAGSSHSLPPSHNYEIQPAAPDHTELLDTARLFLSSAQIQAQSEQTRREFLLKKGLSNAEIEYLMSTVAPAIPARTYPKPPRSRLPYLLASFFRIVTWFAGLSAASMLFYYYLILPRLTLTRNARHHIKFHQLSLMKRLKTGVEAAREAQLESRTAFGLSPPVPSPAPQANAEGESQTIEGPTESKGEPAPPSQDDPTTSQPPTAPLLPSLSLLKTTIRSSGPPSSETFAFGGSVLTPQARTLQSLTSLTAYISSQMYVSTGGRANSYASYGAGGGFGVRDGDGNGNAAAEEMRREIKALKGLVLNRRTFTSLVPPSPVS